jgi:hypothetical protein
VTLFATHAGAARTLRPVTRTSEGRATAAERDRGRSGQTAGPAR